jgi:hypothetical protein
MCSHATPPNSSFQCTTHHLTTSPAPAPHREHSLDDTFYIYDLANVTRLFKAWRAAMPRVLPFYAVKCNPEPAILKLLFSLGAGFDCASQGERQGWLAAVSVCHACEYARQVLGASRNCLAHDVNAYAHPAPSMQHRGQGQQS